MACSIRFCSPGLSSAAAISGNSGAARDFSVARISVSASFLRLDEQPAREVLLGVVERLERACARPLRR